MPQEPMSFTPAQFFKGLFFLLPLVFFKEIVTVIVVVPIVLLAGILSAYVIRISIELLALLLTDSSQMILYFQTFSFPWNFNSTAPLLMPTSYSTHAVTGFLTLLVTILIGALLQRATKKEKQRPGRRMMFDDLIEWFGLSIALGFLLVLQCSLFGQIAADVFFSFREDFKLTQYSLDVFEGQVPAVFATGSIFYWSLSGLDMIIQPILLGVPKDIGFSFSLIEGKNQTGVYFLLICRLVIELSFLRAVVRKLQSVSN